MRSCRMLQITGLLGLFPGSKIFFFSFQNCCVVALPFPKARINNKLFCFKNSNEKFQGFFFFFLLQGTFLSLSSNVNVPFGF